MAKSPSIHVPTRLRVNQDIADYKDGEETEDTNEYDKPKGIFFRLIVVFFNYF